MKVTRQDYRLHGVTVRSPMAAPTRDARTVRPTRVSGWIAAPQHSGEGEPEVVRGHDFHGCHARMHAKRAQCERCVEARCALCSLSARDAALLKSEGERCDRVSAALAREATGARECRKVFCPACPFEPCARCAENGVCPACVSEQRDGAPARWEAARLEREATRILEAHPEAPECTGEPAPSALDAGELWTFLAAARR